MEREIREFPSPHYREYRLAKVDTVIIHYISAINIDKDNPFDTNKILDLLTKPIKFGSTAVKVSAHYLITREGVVYRLVDEKHVSWHSGTSQMPDGRKIRDSVNDFSIGIELEGGDWIEFTNDQYECLIKLLKSIVIKYNVGQDFILGHCDVAPGRKQDPGKQFDWDRVLTKVFSPVEPAAANKLTIIPKKTDEPEVKPIDITDGRDIIDETSPANNKTVWNKLINFLTGLFNTK